MNKNIFRGLVASSVLVAAGAAQAAVPTDITDAITGAGTDGATVAAAVLVAIVGIWAFSLIRKGIGR